MISYEEIKQAMADLDEETLLNAMHEVIDEKGNVNEALAAMQEGMTRVGDLFEEGEYFVADLIFAGEIMTDAMEIIKPALAEQGDGSVGGKMLICTVKDDLHDIGKNIVRALLEASGFTVLDLGTDAAPEKIVETARAEGIKIIALSGVLTLALDSMKKTVEAFTAAGMRDSVKIIIGGAPVSAAACEACGADAWAKSPQTTVETCRAWLA